MGQDGVELFFRRYEPDQVRGSMISARHACTPEQAHSRIRAPQVFRVPPARPQLINGSSARLLASRAGNRGKVEAGNILEVLSVPCEQSVSVLDRLTGDPDILDSVSVSTAAQLQTSDHSTEHVRGVSVDDQDWLSLKPTQCSQPLLPHA